MMSIITTEDLMKQVINRGNAKKHDFAPVEEYYNDWLCAFVVERESSIGSFQLDLDGGKLVSMKVGFNGQYCSTFTLDDGNWISFVHASQYPYRLGLQGAYSDVGVQPFISLILQMVRPIANQLYDDVAHMRARCTSVNALSIY